MTFPKLLGSLDPTTLVKEDSFQTENLKQQKIASQNVNASSVNVIPTWQVSSQA